MIPDIWNGEERRKESCPCKSVVKLSSTTQGEFRLLTQQIKTINKDITENKEYFDELKMAIKECLNELSEGGKLFQEGRFEVEKIHQGIADIGEDLTRHIEDDHRKISKHINLLLLAVCWLVVFLLATGHSMSLAQFIKDVL